MEKLNHILRSHVAEGEDTKDKLLGAAFIVVNKDGVLFEGSAGRIDFPVDSKPWTLNSLSFAASLTKLPSAISLLQLVERGLLTLDEDLRPKIDFLAEVQIIRGFDDAKNQPIMEPNTSPITLRHLLTHTSGLGYDLPNELLMKWRKSVGKEKLNLTWTVEGFTMPLLFTPGTNWMYGVGIDWATLLLEKLTGQSLQDYMKEHIFTPLQIENSSLGPKNAAKTKDDLLQILAKVPLRGPDGVLGHGEFPHSLDDYEVESGGAGLMTTASDYSKVLQAVLQGRLLSKESMELLFAPQLEGELLESLVQEVQTFEVGYAPEYPPGTPINFALGGMLNVEDIPGKRSKGSMMWSGFANSHWWIDQKKGIAAVLQVSVLPYPDLVVVKLYDELERAVYGGLVN